MTEAWYSHLARLIQFETMNLRTALLLAPILMGLGCNKPAIQPAPTKPPEVIIDRPVLQDVQDAEEFPGRTEPVKNVEIRSQVTGAMEKVHFKDGTDIAAGQTLFSIDSRVFRSELDKAKATVVQMKARFDRVSKDYERLKGIQATGAGSKEEFDRVTGDKAEAEAAVAVAEATVQLAQTNLEYCTITAPFAGRVSRRTVDPGNIIKANETVLTTILTLDPIYAYFEVDERTLLRLRRLITQAPSAAPSKTIVQISLSDESGYSRTGVVDFMDNQVNSSTGTIRMRAVVENKSNLLSPGLFCRLRLPIGSPHQAVLIPEETIVSDQGQKYVFVVNEKEEVTQRPIVMGFQMDKMRVIEKGLTPNDRIIVKGLQRVRPGVKVTAKEMEKTSAAPVASKGPHEK